MLIVYRKSDKQILFNSGKSFVEPQGMSSGNGKLAVIEQVGGDFNDYGTFRLHDIEEKEKVDEILKYKGYVSLVFQDDVAINYFIDYEKYALDKQLFEEQQLLEKLLPSQEDILKAEIEITTINLLMEVGLI